METDSMEEFDLNSPDLLSAGKLEEVRPSLPDKAPDPRIQIEFECLNTLTDTINKLEVNLDESTLQFRQLLIDSTQKIDALAKRLGKCIDQSRPYYEARIKAKQAVSETQKAPVRYERAMSQTKVKSLQKELKRAVAKSSLNTRRSLLQMNNLVRMHQLQLLPYFELKAAVNHQLENQKQRVKELEDSVPQSKNTYSQALHNLETISDEIHRTSQSHVEFGVQDVGAVSTRSLQLTGRELIETGLHYTSQVFQDAGDEEEFRSLPSKLGFAASPLIAASLSEEFLISSSPVSQESVRIDKCSSPPQELGNNTFTETAQSSAFIPLGLNEDEYNAGDILEESEVGETKRDISKEFKGWQVVDVSTVCPSLISSHQYITVEDRDSIVSDTESLASIEMLSDEDIAGLMMEEELA